MKLLDIYKSDINRDINGVIKVAQNDAESIEQELREYIITKELRKHFDTFFNNYEKSLNCPTDKIAETLNLRNDISVDIKTLSLSQKINTLSSLTTMDKSMMDLLRRYTSVDIDKKMAELTVALGKKKDIVTIPKAQQKMFLNNILANNNKEAENVLKTFDFEQYEKHGLPLKYSRAEFTANIENIVKDLSPEEQILVLEHFGLVRGTVGFDGLPNNKPFNNTVIFFPT